MNILILINTNALYFHQNLNVHVACRMSITVSNTKMQDAAWVMVSSQILTSGVRMVLFFVFIICKYIILKGKGEINPIV